MNQINLVNQTELPTQGVVIQRKGNVMKLIEKAMFYLLFSLVTMTIVFPFIWMLLTSFKPENKVVTFPPQLFSDTYTVINYIDVMLRVPFGMFFVNTVIFATATTLISLFLDSLSAYALARFKFPGRDALFLLILATMMVPFQVTMIPLFLTIFNLGMINTFVGLILPRATNAFGIFMLRQFFMTIPAELEDAARIEGCGAFRIYWQIILPLSKPALATLAVLHFTYNWNDLMWPMIVTTSTEMRTLPSGLALFMGTHVVEYALLMAGATIALLPLAIIFILAQRHFMEGLSFSGVKG